MLDNIPLSHDRELLSGRWVMWFRAGLSAVGFALPLLCAAAPSTANPFLGSSCPDQVQRPDRDELKAIDNGVFRDEACRTIYVRPPVRGDFKLSGVAPSGALDLCQGYNAYRNGFNQAAELAVNAIGDPDRYLQADAVQQSVWRRLTGFDNVEGMTASVLMSTRWNDLIGEYAKLNSSQQVLPLPIVGAYLLYTSRGYSGASAAVAQLLNERQLPAAISVKIPGINAISPDLQISNITSDPQVVFGSSLSGQVVLSLHGACPFYDLQSRQLRMQGSEANYNELVSLYPYIVSNVFYFYPVQVRSGYTVSFNADFIADALASVIVEGTTFSNSRITDQLFKLEGTAGYTITINNNDFVRTATSVDISELKREITSSFVSTIITKFADPTAQQPPLPTVVPPNDPHYEVTSHGVQCRSISFFGVTLRRNCQDVVYRVRQPAPGQAFGRSTIRNAVSATWTGTVQTTSFVVQRDTLSFVDLDAVTPAAREVVRDQQIPPR